MSLPNFFIKIPYTLIGPGSIERIKELLHQFDAQSALVITDRGIKEAGLLAKISDVLKKTGCSFTTFDSCEPNSPSSTVEKCIDQARAEKPGVLIALGGGSVIDTAKIVSVAAATKVKLTDLPLHIQSAHTVLPKIVIPTTSGTGSEWSRIALYTDISDGQKKMLRSIKLFPEAVIIDPELLLDLPQRITADTGIDALSHGIEAYTSPVSNYVGDMFCETAIKLVSGNLLRAYNNGKDIDARYNMAVAASLGMASLTVNGGGLAHMMDGPIIGCADVSHGAALAIILPAVMEYNIPSNPEKYARLAVLMGARISGHSLDEAASLSVAMFRKLCGSLGMKHRLSEIGIKKDDLSRIKDNIVKLAGSRLAMYKPDDIIKILNSAL